MASVKLTNALRDDIRSNALKGALEVERADLRKRLQAIGDAVYRLLVTEEQEKQMKKLPTGFFTTGDGLHFTPYHDAVSMGGAGGRRKDFPLSTDRRMPQFFAAYTLPVIVGSELMKEIEAVEKENIRLIDLKDTLKANINGVLNSVGTVARLLIVWPEVAKFLPAYATNPKLTNLPAVMVDELNAMLSAAKHEELAVVTPVAETVTELAEGVKSALKD